MMVFQHNVMYKFTLYPRLTISSFPFLVVLVVALSLRLVEGHAPDDLGVLVCDGLLWLSLFFDWLLRS